MFYIGARGLPERDISSLGVMGWLDGGAGGVRNYSAAVIAAAIAVTPQNSFWGKNKILRFVTHSRAMIFLEAAN